MLGTVTHATAQGPRPAQEDRWVVADLGEQVLIAVMDGHGGETASVYCAEHLSDEVSRFLEEGHPPAEALRSAIAVLERGTNEVLAGTSLTAAIVEADGATLAILGDSPAVWKDASGEVRIGPVHNAQTDPDGRQAALERGAEYAGGYLIDPGSGEGVALTRVLGDAGLPFLERTPEVFRVDLASDAFVVCATDGVFTRAAGGPEALARRLEELVGGGADAGEVVEDAMAKGTEDNVTVVLWRAGV